MCVERERYTHTQRVCGRLSRVGSNETFSTVSRVIGIHLYYTIYINIYIYVCVRFQTTAAAAPVNHFDSFRVIINYYILSCAQVPPTAVINQIGCLQ